MAPKKGRRARRGDDDSDDDLKTQASAGTEAAEAENPPANQKKTSKKKQVGALHSMSACTCLLYPSDAGLLFIVSRTISAPALICSALPCMCRPRRRAR